MIYGIALGGMEIMVIAGVILFLFGGRKIPELMRGLAQGIGEFKKVKQEADLASLEIKKAVKELEDG